MTTETALKINGASREQLPTEGINLMETESQKQEQTGALAVASGSARPGDAGVWSVGDPNNPSRDDALCGAEWAARENAAAISTTRVAAVWCGSECIALYFEGQPWRRG